MFTAFLLVWLALGLTATTYLFGYAAGRNAERRIWIDAIGEEIVEGIDEVRDRALLLSLSNHRGGGSCPKPD